MRYEVLAKSKLYPSAFEHVLWTVRWKWLARLIVLTYQFPNSPCYGARYRVAATSSSP